jgi:hypothetical protein
VNSDDIKSLAAQTYNAAFEMLEDSENPDLLEVVELAATSLNMWRRVGNARNLTIGYWLFARALAKSGSAELALHAAKDCEEHLGLVKDPADWLLASCAEGYARALHLNALKGNVSAAEYNAARAELDELLAKIADSDDRELISGQAKDLPKSL